MARLTAAMKRPLTLVNGPAGAGKTVLTAEWVTAGLAPPATTWLTVEPGDAPGTFWAYVLEALGRHEARLLAEVGRPTRAEGVEQSFLVRLAGGLAESAEPVVLVLDQFDTACEREITEGLQFVLRHATDGLRLVLTGRTDPLLPLHRYRAAGEITEIRNADLRFTRPQATVLLREHGLEISEAGLRLLVERTDGWAAGLRLCALAMQQSADPEAFVREFAADRTTIADYLLNEVLDAQPPPTQDLLLRTCITERIHPELADVLTGHDDGDRTLAALARDNAFLERVDGTAWYHLHPLFAEVLRTHLRRRCPGLEPVLHGQAAHWLAGAGRLTEAVTQAAAAGDWQFAADQLVGNMAIGRLLTGLESEQLCRTFAAMPPDLPGAAPALVRAACRLTEQDLDGCTAGLRRADEQLTDAAGPAGRLSRELVGVLAGRLAHDLKATGKAAAAADQLLHALPAPVLGHHREIRAMVLTGLGAAELAAGHLDRAEAGLTAAVEACDGPGTEYPLCDALESLALVELLRGRLRQAAQHARGSSVVAERSGSVLSRERRTALGHLVLAGVATEHDDLRNARTQLGLATAPDGSLPEPVAEVTAAVIAARLATAEGDWEGALAAVRAVGTTAGPLYLPEWTADELAIAESWAQLAHGDPGAALDILDAAASDRPEHTVARARALLAAGHSDRAVETLAELSPHPDISATIRTRACILQAQAAVQNSSTDEAQRFLREALACARPERLRRVFVESGPWVGRLLRQNPQLARAHAWLPAHLLECPGARSIGRSPRVLEPLSERESEVLRLAARMLSTEEIAAELYLSANTVKTHLKSIYRKLSVTRRSEAVHRAQDLGIL